MLYGAIKNKIHDIGNKAETSECRQRQITQVQQWEPRQLDRLANAMSVRVLRYSNGTYDTTVEIVSPDIARAIHALVLTDLNQQHEKADKELRDALTNVNVGVECPIP